MTLRPAWFLGAALLAAPPQAVAGQPFVGQAEAQRIAEDNRLVCKTFARTGTRVLDKSCMTRLQWEQLSILQQRELKELANRPMHNAPERVAAQTQDR